MVFVPVVVEVREHCPAATVAVHVLRPSLTVTLPFGVPLPGLLAVTLYATVYACPPTVAVPNEAGLVIAVVVVAGLTV